MDRNAFWIILAATLAPFPFSCGNSEPQFGDVVPLVVGQTVRSNPNNVLSVSVDADVRDASTAQVELRDNSGTVLLTPPMNVDRTPLTLSVLGLKPTTRYTCRVLAFSPFGFGVRGPEFEIQTDSLPVDLPRVSVTSNTGATSGYVMLAMPSATTPGRHYAFIVSNDGHVVWYRSLAGSMLDFQKQPDGSYSVFSSPDTSAGRFLQMDNLGNIMREYRALTVPETGPHELRLKPDGHALFGIEFREMDLTSLGGLANAQVRGITVEYTRSTGAVFEWDAFDYFQVGDALPDVDLTGSTVNPWHGNAIDVDTDGNLLVSFRGLGEITKINSLTGEIVWRMGGRNNEFTFVNDPLNGFSHQHGVRRLHNGNIILFDNGGIHMPQQSRAVEYRVNENARTAELVWEFRPNPPLYTPVLGFAQRLVNGHTMICFGRTQRIFEVDEAGAVAWELRVVEPGRYPYRALRIDSLY